MLRVAALAALPSVASAFVVSVPNTFVDLLWGVSTSVPGLTSCTELQVDATGDLVNSTKVTIYGALNCAPSQGGSQGVVGSAYFGGDGSFNMTLLIGPNVVLQCVRLGGSLGGPCNWLDTSGASLGGAFVTFL
jgi:hypothetical protein